LAIENKLLTLAFGALNVLALSFDFGMGVVSIDAFLVCLKSSNFHDENLVAFRLIFVAEIWQCFASNVS